MESKQYALRKRILHIYTEDSTASYRTIARRLGIGKSTVANVINNFIRRLSIERKPGTGRKTGPVCKKTEAKVVAIFKKNPNISVRDVAKKVGKSSSFVQKVKKRKGLRTFKVRKAPNRTDKQDCTAKTRARKLYDAILTKFECVIMDDETFVKSDFKQLPGQNFFTCINKFDVDKNFKQQKMSKFAGKFLVWQAICTCGKTSKTFVTKGSVNQEIYLEECVKKRLMPLIRSHNTPPLFWPDLATCHYARTVLEWYQRNGINFVPKDKNPPNCPELRPIEKYWALVKQKLKKSQKQPTSLSDFEKEFNKASAALGSTTVCNLMRSVRSKVRKFGYGLK